MVYDLGLDTYSGGALFGLFVNSPDKFSFEYRPMAEPVLTSIGPLSTATVTITSTSESAFYDCEYPYVCLAMFFSMMMTCCSCSYITCAV